MRGQSSIRTRCLCSPPLFPGRDAKPTLHRLGLATCHTAAKPRLTGRLLWLPPAFFAIVTLFALTPSRLAAQSMPAVIGHIEGDDVEVKTATSVGVETDAAPADVASGSDITVRSGHALLLLDHGEVTICGPAHLQLHKSGRAITLALDYGRVRPSLDSPDTLTIYTPMIVATPVAIGGAARDITLGLDPEGQICVLTTRGAMRVEEQLTSRSVLVPQGGDVILAGGQIDSLHGDTGSCGCDFVRETAETTRPAAAREVSPIHPPVEPARPETAPEPPTPPPVEQPVYTVVMPPLSFDASSPAPPPDPTPETLVLVRELRLRPNTVFRGHVSPAPTPVAAALPPAPPPASAPHPQPQPQSGLFSRMRNFFRRWTGQPPCSGAGCGS